MYKIEASLIIFFEQLPTTLVIFCIFFHYSIIYIFLLHINILQHHIITFNKSLEKKPFAPYDLRRSEWSVFNEVPKSINFFVFNHPDDKCIFTQKSRIF